MGTIQLEFRQLSHYTGDPKYAAACDKISHMLEGIKTHNGLWNTYIDRRSGREGSPFLVSSTKTPKLAGKVVVLGILGLFWVKTTSSSGHHSRFGTTPRNP